MEIEITVRRVAGLAPDVVKTGLREGMRRVSLVLYQHAARNATTFFRQRTGGTRASLVPEVREGDGVISAVVGSASPTAQWLEFGTRPHDIVPRVKRALRWPAQTATVGAWPVATRRGEVLAGGRERVLAFAFAKRVYHPGTAPRPFLATALESTGALAPDIIAKAIEQAVAKGGGAAGRRG